VICIVIVYVWHISYTFIFDLHRAFLDVQRPLLEVDGSLFESEYRGHLKIYAYVIHTETVYV